MFSRGLILFGLGITSIVIGTILLGAMNFSINYSSALYTIVFYGWCSMDKKSEEHLPTEINKNKSD